MKDKTIPIQNIPFESDFQIHLDILRADLNHPFISGNKLWKLQNNLRYAVDNQKDTIISFGGAYSNHIFALAHAASEKNLKSVGIIRGDELASCPLNTTLNKAKELGMQLHFVSREEYRLKEESTIIQEIIDKYSNSYLIPEGGTNESAVQGVSDYIKNYTSGYDYIICAVGTGGTIAGISRASSGNQQIIGIPVLKNGQFLENEIRKFTSKDNFQLDLRYHFGGYGKFDEKLEEFIKMFYRNFKMPLDLIYTSKMMYAIMENIKINEFPKNSRILAVHTGGLQGNQGKFKF